jgi:hypothetical protein
MHVETSKLISRTAGSLRRSQQRKLILCVSESITDETETYALVTVSGGVADLSYTEGSVNVEILDFDNLESTGPADLILSDNEWEYLKANNPELFQFFAPSYAKKDETQ